LKILPIHGWKKVLAPTPYPLNWFIYVSHYKKNAGNPGYLDFTVANGYKPSSQKEDSMKIWRFVNGMIETDAQPRT